MNTENPNVPFEEPTPLNKAKGETALYFYNENPRQQMKRNHHFVESGLYEEWLRSRTDEQLQEYIEQNEGRIQYMGQHARTNSQKCLKYVWRNTFYRLELLRREHGEDIPADLYKEWFLTGFGFPGFSIQTMSLEE